MNSFCRWFGHSWLGIEGSILRCKRCQLFWDEDLGGPAKPRHVAYYQRTRSDQS